MTWIFWAVMPSPTARSPAGEGLTLFMPSLVVADGILIAIALITVDQLQGLGVLDVLRIRGVLHRLWHRWAQLMHSLLSRHPGNRRRARGRFNPDQHSVPAKAVMPGGLQRCFRQRWIVPLLSPIRTCCSAWTAPARIQHSDPLLKFHAFVVAPLTAEIIPCMSCSASRR